jgi:hypothetical protein
LIGLRLQLTRLELEIIELESRDAVKEALLCVRQDGMSMEEVATEQRYPYRRTEFLLEELPEDAQDKYLSVSPGDVLELMPQGEGFQLCRIINKIEPQADDPGVKSRLDQHVLKRHFSELATKYISRSLGVPVSAE